MASWKSPALNAAFPCSRIVEGNEQKADTSGVRLSVSGLRESCRTVELCGTDLLLLLPAVERDGHDDLQNEEGRG